MTDEQVAAARRDLATRISGRISGPTDPGFESATMLDNGRIRRPPRLVVIPASTADLAETVRYCKLQDIRLTTKSGGHGGNGYCLNSEGIVVDLVDLNGIRPHDCGTKLSIGAGARWIQVYDHIQQTQNDHIVVGGGCGAVGLGGFLLGGGYSFISRSYGLGCDNIHGLEFVSAEGDVHNLYGDVTEPREQELYWALRGGGGGNFGIVSQVDLALHKRPSPAMMMGSVSFPIDRAKELLHFYNEWSVTLPSELAVYGMIRRFPDPRHGGAPSLMLRFAPTFNGRFEQGVALLKPLIDMSPIGIELHAMTLPEWESFIGNGTMIAGRSAYIRSVAMAKHGLSSEVIDLLVDGMSRAPSPDSYIVWTHAGGKIRDPENAARSAFARRDAEFVFELKSIWARGTSSDVARANIEWAIGFFDALGHHAQGAYLNYVDPMLIDWQSQYYGDQYARLLKVKEAWDPRNVFGFQQGIGSSFSSQREIPLDIECLNVT